MSEVNSVVETAVERTSWGKSRNELLCRFHNSGGLHRISGDAPLETRILTHEENHVNSRIIDIPGVVNKLQLDGRSTSGVKINGANTDVILNQVLFTSTTGSYNGHYGIQLYQNNQSHD